VIIGDRLAERLQMLYSGERATFEAPFFVLLPKDQPDGITLRVIAADPASGNGGIGQSNYPVHSEHLRHSSRSKPH
jgi:hypothetical protein